MFMRDFDIDAIDWSRVCLHLRSRYKPLSAIARDINADPMTLQRLARGEVETVKIGGGMR